MNIADTVTPLLAELVGRLTFVFIAFCGNYIWLGRRQEEGSGLHGHSHSELAPHVVRLL